MIKNVCIFVEKAKFKVAFIDCKCG